MNGARLAQVAAAAALAAACAASPDDARVGERVLPDTRAVAEHFRAAVAMQGPYGFQMAKQPEAARPAPVPTPESTPATPSFWARLWPAAAASGPAPPQRLPKPPRKAASESSIWEHFWPPLTPAKATRPPAASAPVPAVAEARRPRPAAAPAAVEGEGSGLSEVRFGVLKHAVSFGHRAKEQGMDGNVEALFRSPAWLAWAWSPRPHLGITANASRRATDFLYGGLTWEWAFWEPLFVNVGLGLSIHDGMLDNSMIEGRARFDRREFGCRALFRESVEFGYRFLERHSLSLMWAHHSHGSLCDEENEGIDNAGLRYGLRM